MKREKQRKIAGTRTTNNVLSLIFHIKMRKIHSFQLAVVFSVKIRVRVIVVAVAVFLFTGFPISIIKIQIVSKNAKRLVKKRHRSSDTEWWMAEKDK